MKRFLLLFLFTLCVTYNILSQSSGNFSANNLCYNATTNCSNASNTHQIVMPYDGKIMFSGTVSSTSTSGEPVNFTINAYTNYTNNEGNPSGQNTGEVFNQTGPNIEFETQGLQAGVTIDLSIFANLGFAYWTGAYNISYIVVPPTYNNDPEPNDDYTQAILTTENTLYEGNGQFIPSDINNIAESDDWYKLTAPTNGTLNVTISHDTFIENYYSTSIQMYKQNADGSATSSIGYQISNTNGLLLASAYCLKQGDVVFLKIAGNDNSYRMSWNMQEPLGYIDTEPNDIDSQAITINLDETKYGNIGYGISPDASGNALDDDTDWYKFIVTESGDASINLNAPQTYVRILEAYYKNPDSSLTPISYENVGGTYTTLNFNCVTQGTYYVKVEDTTTSPIGNGSTNGGSCQDCCSTYSITYTFSNAAVNSSDETEPNNDIGIAEYLSFNTNFNGQIGYSISNQVDNIDYYEIQTNYNGALEISFSTPFSGTALMYYNDNGTLVTTGTLNTNTNNEVTSVSVPCAAENETYYLWLYSSTCTSYQLYATNTYTNDNEESEPNNDILNSQELENSDNVFGQIGYGTYSNFDSYDYYSIPISTYAPIEFYFDLYGDAIVELRNSFTVLTSISQNQSSGSISSLTYNNIEENEDYYLRISSNSCVDYDLYGWHQGFASNNDTEPNNLQTEATAINFNQDYEGRLSYYNSGNDAADYYSFSLAQNDDVEFILNAYEGLVNTASLTVYDASNDNQVLQLNHDGTNTSRTSNTVNLNSGSYYFSITGIDQTGSYNFKVTPQNTLSTIGNSLNDSVLIYPIPAKNNLKISIDNNFQDITASIVDITGKLIDIIDINSQETQINISNLKSGLYFIKLKTEKSSTIKRFIKQ